MKRLHAHRRGNLYAGANPYFVATIAAGLCSLVSFVPFPPLQERFAFMPLFPAIAVAGYFGGFRPAMLAAVIGAGALYLYHPVLRALGGQAAVSCIMFLGVAAIMGLLSEALLVQRRRAMKAAESTSELRQLQARLEQIAAVSPDCLTIFDLEAQRVDYVNRAVTRLLGYTPEEALQRSLHDIFADCHPDDRVQVHLALDALQTSVPGQVIEFEIRQRHRDGTFRWFRNRVIVLDRTAEGKVRQLVVHSEDVSDRRAMMEALNTHAQQMREQAEQLELAMDAAQLGAWRYDPAAQKQYLSPQARRNLGFTLGPEVTIDEFLGVLEPEDCGRVQDAIARAFGGDMYEGEYRVRWPDGSVHWIASRGRVVTGDTALLIGVNQDITARKNAEMEREQLLHAERVARGEAERANRLKDEFLATVSHELRTPLTAILGWASILEEICPEGEAQQGVDVISRNARAQRQLIDDLLDMSRILSGKLRLEVGPVLLPRIIDAAIDTVSPAAQARGVTLTRWFADCGEPIQADADRLQQIIWNLMSNAVKFTPAGGQVRITAQRTDHEAILQVQDTGQGIAPEFVPYVFERFRQEDASATRKHGGLGLGLAIVKHLVELHGGSVSVASEGLGKGATFTVKLPCEARAMVRPAARAVQSSPATTQASLAEKRQSLSGYRVLVIDDEADTRSYLQRILAERGATVSVAESAEEGLKCMQSEPPDAVICDISMPGEDGYSFVRRLRALPEDGLAKTPVAALTAFARAEDRERALAAGFSRHCPKPIEPSDLVSLLQEMRG